MNGYFFTSERLGFRAWKEADCRPFAQLNSNPIVRQFFPKTLTPAESQQQLAKIKKHFESQGYGLYAIDKLESQEFIGFIGFAWADFEADFTPCIEIGWRLRQQDWNKGYATEGAKRCLSYGFDSLSFTTVFSFTAKVNLASERVMLKIGMKKIGEFEHSKVATGHVLKTHVLYRIDKTQPF